MDQVPAWLLHLTASIYSRVYDIFSHLCKYFLGLSGAGEVYLNTSTSPEKYLYIYIHLHVSDSPREAWKVFIYTFPAPEKYLYTLLRRKRSVYIFLSDAGEAREIFVYTAFVIPL